MSGQRCRPIASEPGGPLTADDKAGVSRSDRGWLQIGWNLRIPDITGGCEVSQSCDGVTGSTREGADWDRPRNWRVPSPVTSLAGGAEQDLQLPCPPTSAWSVGGKTSLPCNDPSAKRGGCDDRERCGRNSSAPVGSSGGPPVRIGATHNEVVRPSGSCTATTRSCSFAVMGELFADCCCLAGGAAEKVRSCGSRVVRLAGSRAGRRRAVLDQACEQDRAGRTCRARHLLRLALCVMMLDDGLLAGQAGGPGLFRVCIAPTRPILPDPAALQTLLITLFQAVRQPPPNPSRTTRLYGTTHSLHHPPPTRPFRAPNLHYCPFPVLLRNAPASHAVVRV